MPPSAARLCYFVQLLDENGNGSPLALIGCKDVMPPKPPTPVLSEPAPAGNTHQSAGRAELVLSDQRRVSF